MRTHTHSVRSMKIEIDGRSNRNGNKECMAMQELISKTEQTKAKQTEEKKEVWHLISWFNCNAFFSCKPNVKFMSIRFMRSLITSSLSLCVWVRMRWLRCISVLKFLCTGITAFNFNFNFICACVLFVCFHAEKNCLKCIQMIRKSTVKKETESRKRTTHMRASNKSSTTNHRKASKTRMRRNERHNGSLVTTLPPFIPFSSCLSLSPSFSFLFTHRMWLQ